MDKFTMLARKSRALLPLYAADEDGLPSTLPNHANNFVGMLVVTQLKTNHFRTIFGQATFLFFFHLNFITYEFQLGYSIFTNLSFNSCIYIYNPKNNN